VKLGEAPPGALPIIPGRPPRVWVGPRLPTSALGRRNLAGIVSEIAGRAPRGQS